MIRNRLPTRGLRPAMTLLELMVVVGTIVVVIALFLPALLNARRTAQDVACRNNLRKIWEACQRYAAQNNGSLPIGPLEKPNAPIDPSDNVPVGIFGYLFGPQSNWYGPNVWKRYAEVEEYISQDGRIWEMAPFGRCPTSGMDGTTNWPDSTAAFSNGSADHHPNPSYGFNAFVVGHSARSLIHNLKSETFVMGEAVTGKPGYAEELHYVHGSHGLSLAEQNALAPRTRSPSATANLLFGDGHVGSLSYGDVPDSPFNKSANQQAGRLSYQPERTYLFWQARMGHEDR